MPETEHTQENIAYIRTHVDEVEQLTRFAIASNPSSADFIRKHLEDREGAPEIYLSVAEGPKSLDEIVEASRKSKATVSRVCTHLWEQGLIAKVPDPANARSFRYCVTGLENMLKVSKIARQIVAR